MAKNWLCYEAEEKLVNVLDEVLHPPEILLRTRFAYDYGQIIGATGTFAHSQGFTQPQSPGAERVEEHALAIWVAP